MTTNYRNHDRIGRIGRSGHFQVQGYLIRGRLRACDAARAEQGRRNREVWKLVLFWLLTVALLYAAMLGTAAPLEGSEVQAPPEIQAPPAIQGPPAPNERTAATTPGIDVREFTGVLIDATDTPEGWNWHAAVGTHVGVALIDLGLTERCLGAARRGDEGGCVELNPRGQTGAGRVKIAALQAGIWLVMDRLAWEVHSKGPLVVRVGHGGLIGWAHADVVIRW